MALTPTIFSQVRTHIRQRMHFTLSLSGVNRGSGATPISAAISLSCLDSGQRARSSWRTRRRTFITRSLFVSTASPSATGYRQDVTMRVLFPCLASTTHRRHDPVGSRDSWLHRVGMTIPFSRATSRTVRPASASIFLLSIVRLIIVSTFTSR